MALPNRLIPSSRLIVSFFAFVVLLVGCTRHESKPEQASSTALLDTFVRIKPSEKGFVDDVRKFYSALAARDWSYTYDGRTQSFKKAVSRELYLSSVSSLSEKVTSFNYEVVGHDEFVVDDIHKKRLIIKFARESAMPEYSVVWWKFEDGHWRCEEVGLKTVPLFNRFNAQDE